LVDGAGDAATLPEAAGLADAAAEPAAEIEAAGLLAAAPVLAGALDGAGLAAEPQPAMRMVVQARVPPRKERRVREVM
jgi:hypothetical protein